ncbi:ABC transporter ATP-binding protein [Pseudonocardia sp. KRD-184]|uniref:ABC transporter ATP-binding protein n=1 Tax=Pseudonocardia oceani TaxID=2792013 RepID=A0ABS6UG99_9PSEU|nr:ABC transporter ATP-binding protein [Pseudonocardia oceani]MBW0088328.1 ABC transporter ATP-binding protein [Pseudonocardia oceani]MBW0096939.1 ABC transporter ATP-binding protein [Pseudonocardia oceani]MBW0109613.1 ABC transporter ATP-binding protein [Pseudonocardia oceani]MBW0130963.1 ABC transporter ATP-binding protein [Pseudonocardia oceani]
MTDALEIAGAHHRYGAHVALDGVDLRVRAGECLALLGPNGAGKTTLIGLATGLLARQAGHVAVCGGDPRRAAVRRHLGVVQQSTGFPATETVGELVRGAAVRAGRPASAAGPVLAEIGVADLAPRRAPKLSGGQRQRVGLAMALVGDPALLLLDEPTVGLDVTARRAFWRVLAGRRDAGVAMLLTTHVVEEAAAFADRVVVLHRGRVVATGTPAELASRLPDRTVSARTALDDVALRALPGVGTLRRDGDRVQVGTTEPEDLLREWLARDRGLSELRVEGAGLEQALVALTGEEVPA